MGAGWFGFGFYANHGTYNLTNSSPAQTFQEPLTLTEIREYLKIDEPGPTENQDDAELNTFIAGARYQAELLQGIDLVRKQWDLSFDYWLTYRIKLRAPLVSVDLVQYTDFGGSPVALVAGRDYTVDKAKRPGTIEPAYNKVWPNFTPGTSSAVLIRLTSGYLPTDPYWLSAGSLVKNGMKMLISSWYNKRLPFDKGISATNEYPYAVTMALRSGAQESVV